MKITEDVRKFAAEQAISEARPCGKAWRRKRRN